MIEVEERKQTVEEQNLYKDGKQRSILNTLLNSNNVYSILKEVLHPQYRKTCAIPFQILSLAELL